MVTQRPAYLRLVTDDFCQRGDQVELIEKISSREGCVPSGTVGEVTSIKGDCLIVRFYLSSLSGRRGAQRLFVMDRREVRRVDMDAPRRTAAPASVDRPRPASVRGELGALAVVPALSADHEVITHDSVYGLRSAASARGLW